MPLNYALIMINEKKKRNSIHGGLGFSDHSLSCQNNFSKKKAQFVSTKVQTHNHPNSKANAQPIQPIIVS